MVRATRNWSLVYCDSSLAATKPRNKLRAKYSEIAALNAGRWGFPKLVRHAKITKGFYYGRISNNS